MQRQSKRQKKEENLCGICISREITANVDCCRHQFCKTCIKDWVKGENKSCPLCRQEVNFIKSIRTGRNLYKVRRERAIAENAGIDDADYDPYQQESEEQVDRVGIPLVRPNVRQYEEYWDPRVQQFQNQQRQLSRQIRQKRQAEQRRIEITQSIIMVAIGIICAYLLGRIFLG